MSPFIVKIVVPFIPVIEPPPPEPEVEVEATPPYLIDPAPPLIKIL